MKLANYGIVFSALFLCLMLRDDVRTQELSAVAALRIQYNNALDNALEGALLEAAELDDGRRVYINKQEVMDKFLTGLYVNFDAMEAPDRKILLEACVPVAAFIDTDRAAFTFKEDGSRVYREVFYREMYDDVQVNFTLGSYVYVKNTKTGFTVEGDFHDVKKQISLDIFEEDCFDRERRRVIINTLNVYLTHCVKKHNQYARKLGITYEFAFPSIEEEEWYRTIDDISFLAVFQGYPYGNYQTGHYSKVAFGGARIRKDGRNEF